MAGCAMIKQAQVILCRSARRTIKKTIPLLLHAYSHSDTPSDCMQKEGDRFHKCAACRAAQYGLLRLLDHSAAGHTVLLCTLFVLFSCPYRSAGELCGGYDAHRKPSIGSFFCHADGGGLCVPVRNILKIYDHIITRTVYSNFNLCCK